MAGYFELISSQLGINIWLIVMVIMWSAVWKLLGLWKSARNRNIAWFIVLAVFNTVGILPILYIFVFSKMKPHAKKKKKKK